MKSTSKMMVVAVVFLVAAAMLVMPAAARAVNPGDTVFEFEENLDLTALNTSVSGDLKYLVKYSEDNPEKGELKSISVSDTKAFSLVDADLGGQYGKYYAVNSSGAQKAVFVNIREPKMTLDVVLYQPKDDTKTIAGQTVTKANNVTFKIVASDIATYLKGADNAQVKIEVTTPGGAKLTQFGNANMTSLNITKSTTLVGKDKFTQQPGVPEFGVSLANVDAGTYSAQVIFQTPDSFNKNAKKSNTVSFTVATKDLTLASNKESVVRNNPFTLTVTGDSLKQYYFYIKDASIAEGKYPTIKSGQKDVAILNTPFSGEKYSDKANTERAKNGSSKTDYADNTAAIVKTSAGGVCVIEFATTTSTEDKTYTIKVQDPKEDTSDDVKVKVEKGAVTITAEGAGSYYFGEEVKLSGTNTDSDTVYLFLVGPNLGTNGVMIDQVQTEVVTGDKETFTRKTVEGDDTWKFTWNTGNLGNKVLSEGSYTIYAVSDPVAKNKISDAKYATFSVNLKKGFITAATNVNTLAKGDDLKITGTAEGKPNNIYVWIFGKNFYGQDPNNPQASESVEDDSTFEYKLDNTDNLASGQYFVIVQHPMAKDDNDHNVYWDVTNGVMKAPGQEGVDLKALPASEAATALINAMDSPNVDDTYTKLTFMVEDAWIRIDSIGDKAVGEKFTVTGTTNLAVGNDLSVDVTSAAFSAAKKTESSGFSGSAGTVKVVEGTDFNKWSFEVDATNYKPDQYQVKVEGVDVSEATATATFNVVEGVTPTPTQPAGNVTTVPPTQTATTAVPSTTPTQPGFGALISLIGLGAVAFLVMRRN